MAAGKTIIDLLKNSSKNVITKKITQLSIDDDPFKRYALFDAMYESNNFYHDIKRTANLNGEWLESIFSIANSAHKSVEFYANRVLSNPRLSTADTALKNALDVFWRDSNFLGNATNYSREVSKKGDLFLKVSWDGFKVYSDRIPAENVSLVETDSRGIVKEIRINVLQDDGKTFTEYWFVENGIGIVRTWMHNFGMDAEIDQLGTPMTEATLDQYGLTYIPIVYAKFTGGDNRAENCFIHAVSKQIEGDREHSRLAEILYAFNTPIWSVSSGSLTEKGQLLGPLTVKLIKTDDGQVIQQVNNGELKSNIPPLDFQSHIALIKLTREEIREDLPETKLNSLDPSQITGIGVERLLGESISRAKNARFNLVQGLRRLDMMAVSLGQYFGYFDKSLGTYLEDDFRHDIICDSIIPLSPSEKSLMLQQFVSGGMPFKSALRQCEYSDTEIEQMMKDKQEEDLALANNLLNNPAFNTGG